MALGIPLPTNSTASDMKSLSDWELLHFMARFADKDFVLLVSALTVAFCIVWSARRIAQVVEGFIWVSIDALKLAVMVVVVIKWALFVVGY
jgi:hypothetical protein